MAIDLVGNLGTLSMQRQAHLLVMEVGVGTSVGEAEDRHSAGRTQGTGSQGKFRSPRPGHGLKQPITARQASPHGRVRPQNRGQGR